MWWQRFADQTVDHSIRPGQRDLGRLTKDGGHWDASKQVQSAQSPYSTYTYLIDMTYSQYPVAGIEQLEQDLINGRMCRAG